MSGSAHGAADARPHVRVTTDREVYAPLDPIYVTLVNEGSYPVHVCTRVVEGWREETGGWSLSYGSLYDCGGDFPTRETVIKDMEQVRPGAAFRDTFVASTYEGRWQVAYTLLDDHGGMLPWGRPVSEFRVVHE